jgi:competence protein ComEC
MQFWQRKQGWEGWEGDDHAASVRHPVIAPLLCGWVAGTAMQLQQPALSGGLIYGVILAISAILASLFAIKLKAKPRGRLVRSVAALVLAGLLAFSACGLRASLFAAHALVPSLEGQDLRVEGVIAAMPQRQAGGTRFRFEVESAERLVSGSEAVAVTLPPLVYLGWYAEPGGSPGVGLSSESAPPELKAGQRWQWVVRLKAPHGNSNPNGFDYELWLWEQGLQATGHVRTGRQQAAPRLVAQTWWHPVEQARQRVRDLIFWTVQDRRTAGIIAALVVGDQAAIERADWDVFRATGVAHLMSISGLHVTLFAWLAAALIGLLWRRSGRLCLALPSTHAGLVGGALLAAAYALFSGWGVPAQRTVLMLSTVVLLRWQGQRWPWPWVWLLAAAVVLAWDPWAGLQAGFWLSFVAVGVLFATEGHRTAPAPDADGAWLRRAARATGRLWREQWVVTLALTPLTLLLFGQVSVVGLFANLLAIPWVTLVVTPLAMLGAVWTPLWAACALALDGLMAVLNALGSLPLATYATAAPAWWAGLAGVLGGVLLAMRLPWGTRCLGLPLLLPVLLWQAPRPAEGQFEVLAADVGQGTAVLVRTATHSLLYDAGPRFGQDSDAGHRVLAPLLRTFNEKLDTLVLSHRDTDHTGGAPAVLAMQPQAKLVSSIEEGHSLQALRPVQRCVAGDRWQWDGVDFEVLHPHPTHYAAALGGKLKPNGLSCVLRVTSAAAAGAHSALLTGDIELPQEQHMLATLPARKLKADLLLVPHHGSKTSSGNAWLAAVSPDWAVVQSGYRNRFGHPVPLVLDRYQALGIQVVDTPRCGAALWSSAVPQDMQCQRRVQTRYWHHPIAAEVAPAPQHNQ